MAAPAPTGLKTDLRSYVFNVLLRRLFLLPEAAMLMLGFRLFILIRLLLAFISPSPFVL